MDQKPSTLPEQSSKDNPHFDNILNFRDVGLTINKFTKQNLLREDRLFRSARPDEASLADRKSLTEHYGIKTVMDLRTKTEHLNAAKKRNADSLVPAMLESNAALAEPVQISGVQYREIKITGRAFEMFLLRQLRWWSLAKLIILMILGYRTKAIAIIGSEVMSSRGLIGLGEDTIDHSGAEIAQGLEAMIATPGLPILIHCTQGKDRTGLMVLLVLLILEVPLDAISYDYHLTDGELVSEQESRLKEIREMGMPDDFGSTAPQFVEKLVAHLEAKYGGLNAYLDKIGFGKEKRLLLRGALAA